LRATIFKLNEILKDIQMDIKVAAAAGLAIVVGLGVQAGLHQHHVRVFNSPQLAMMDASNTGFPIAEFNTDWQDQAEQISEQKDCIRQGLESARSEMRRTMREQMSSARQERESALAQAHAVRDQVRSEVRDSVREQLSEQRDRLREQQQMMRDQVRQQRDQMREQQQRLRDQIKDSATLD
jgi:hypothetical protein